MQKCQVYDQFGSFVLSSFYINFNFNINIKLLLRKFKYCDNVEKQFFPINFNEIVHLVFVFYTYFLVN